MNYWEECISSSFVEHDIIATKEQIEAIATDIQCAHENYGMVFHVPENPLAGELKKVKSELQKEKEKTMCRECNGRCRIYSNMGTRIISRECSKCNGEGKI